MNTNITNHLWQSTLFAAAAFGLALALRGNRAAVRYWVWLCASVKFLVPCAVLMSWGSHVAWAPAAKKMAAPVVAVAVERVAEPFTEVGVAAARTDWARAAIGVVWGIGFVGIGVMRLLGWRRVRAAVQASGRMEIAAPVGV
jgi:hypothetical protein